jgi:hypothetical protein
MAGRVSRPYPTGQWYDACGQLADALGWKPRVVRDWFAQCVGVRVLHSVAKLDREVHEEAAFADVLAIFDKRGSVGD